MITSFIYQGGYTASDASIPAGMQLMFLNFCLFLSLLKSRHAKSCLVSQLPLLSELQSAELTNNASL